MTSPAYHGFLVLDKPGGITSRDAVNRAQRWFPRGTKLGHTGTLDPLATGVLVLCVGRGTRLAEYVQAMPKAYRAGILLGARSDTDDADGRVEPLAVTESPTAEDVGRTLDGFVGDIEQVPPAYSAAKLSGSRAYDLARKGREVSLQPRRVSVYAIDVIAYAYPRLEVEVRCGKGTYIRSLARDLGERLGCGGLIETLRRTRVGPFEEGGALKLDADAGAARAALLPLAAAVSDHPHVKLADDDLARLRRGLAVRLSPSALAEGEVAVFDDEGSLAAVACWQPQAGELRPEKVFPL
jgi:tRNA pseudouridine55 synthase